MRIVSIFRSRTRAELAWLRGILVRPRANLEILVAISVVVALIGDHLGHQDQRRVG